MQQFDEMLFGNWMFKKMYYLNKSKLFWPEESTKLYERSKDCNRHAVVKLLADLLSILYWDVLIASCSLYTLGQIHHDKNLEIEINLWFKENIFTFTAYKAITKTEKTVVKMSTMFQESLKNSEHPKVLSEIIELRT